MAEITLINKTGTRSKKGYLVVSNTTTKSGFKYIGVNAQSMIGVVAEEIDNEKPCKICISGECYLYSPKPVKKGDVLRSVKQGDGFPLGVVAVAKNSDAPYLKVGIALENGRGLVLCVISPQYIYTPLDETGTPTVTWDKIVGTPTSFGGAVDGSGTINYLSKFITSSIVGDSIIYDDGTGVGIGTAVLGGYKFNVNGSIYSGDLTIASGGTLFMGNVLIANKAVNDTTEYGLFTSDGNDGAIATWGSDSNKLFYGYAKIIVDAANSRVGINNASPSYSLDVTGTGRFTSNLYAAANVGSVSFVSGFAGSGWQLTNSSSIYTLTVDNLTVRGALTAYELDINKINSINGGMIVSVANGTCTTVNGNNIYFDEDGTSKQIQFAVNDIVRAQNYTGSGIGSYIGQVTSVTHSATYGSAYITCTTLSGTAWDGMELVQVGNTSDTARQNLIYVTAADTNNPYIDVLAGVNSGSFSGKTKARLGNLTGITDSLYGSLTGYGLWSDNVYLTGSIKATGGQIAGWTIDTDAIYTGVKKTSAGYSTSGITIASNGSIRSKFFEIDTNGYAKFVSVDSIFKSTNSGDGDLTGTVVNTQSNVTGRPEIDTITLSGTSGSAEISCNGQSGTAIFISDLATTAANFITDWGDAFSAVGVTITNIGGAIGFTSGNAALNPGASITNTSGTLNGTKTDTQSFILSVARIDTITLSGTSGYAGIVCDAVATKYLYFDYDLTTTAADFVSAYASSYTSGGVTVTSSGDDIIFTSSTPGVDFSGSTTISNVANTYLGRIKIDGNEIWEDSVDSDTSSYIMINRRGYKGQLNRNRHFFVGNGIGGILGQFIGMSGADAPGSVILAGN